MQAWLDRHDREFEDRRQLDHHLAGLIAYAHHQPDKMPKYKRPAPRRERAAGQDHLLITDPAQQQQVVKALIAAFGGATNR